MSEETIYARRNKLYDFLDKCRNKDTGKFKQNNHNTDEHELFKYVLYSMLKERGHIIVVEGIFQNGKRADIVDLTDEIIYEVAVSESEASLIAKSKDYPAKIIVVRPEDIPGNKELIHFYKYVKNEIKERLNYDWDLLS